MREVDDRLTFESIVKDVAQRVPVRISWNGPGSDRVAAGSSAEVTVYTK